MNSIAPNATCPRCNGPASQTFREVYCARDCKPEDTQPHATVPWVVYSGDNLARPDERQGWPPYVKSSASVNPLACGHAVVYRGQLVLQGG